MSLGLIFVIVLIVFLLGGFSGRFGGYGYGFGHGGLTKKDFSYDQNRNYLREYVADRGARKIKS
jgi:hypothetical protein